MREARRQKQLAERDTRSATLHNLHLQREVSKLAHTVPLKTHLAMHDELQACIASQTQLIASLREQLCARDADATGMEESDGEGEGEGEGEAEAEGGAGGGERGGGGGGGVHSPLARLRESVGVDPRRQAPRRIFTGDASKETAAWNWTMASLRHITAVLRDRPMGHILTAIRRLNRMKEMVEDRLFVGEVKCIVRRTIDTISARWSARMSVHIWDRLMLSRARMDDLRHLLSFVYQPAGNTYVQLQAWVNPYDPADFEEFPCIVGRAGRERLFAELAEKCEIVVGENGRCERDARRCASQMYSRYAQAMSNEVYFLAHAPRPPNSIL